MKQDLKLAIEHMCVFKIKENINIKINILAIFTVIFLDWIWTIKTVQQNIQARMIFILNHFLLSAFTVSFFPYSNPKVIWNNKGHVTKVQLQAMKIHISSNFLADILWNWISINTEVI